VPRKTVLAGVSSPKLFFEIVWLVPYFIVLPVLYRTRLIRQSPFVYVSIPVFFFFWLAELWKGLRAATPISVVIAILGIINDNNRRQNISGDCGYLFLLTLMTTGFVHLCGRTMLLSLYEASTSEGATSVLVTWIVWCFGFKILWYVVSIRATSSKSAPIFCFPFQLAVDIYDELVFGIVSWRRWYMFCVFLIIRCLLNLVYNSAAYLNFVKYFSNKLNEFLCRKKSQRVTPLYQERIRDAQATALKCIFYGQNIFSERAASLAVLISFCTKIALAEANGKLSFEDLKDYLISHVLSAGAVLCSTHIAGVLLHKMYRSQLDLIKCPRGHQASTEPANESDNDHNNGRRVRFDLPAPENPKGSIDDEPQMDESHHHKEPVPHPKNQPKRTTANRKIVAATIEHQHGFNELTTDTSMPTFTEIKNDGQGDGVGRTGTSPAILYEGSTSLEQTVHQSPPHRIQVSERTTSHRRPCDVLDMKIIWHKHLWFYLACLLAAISESLDMWEEVLNTVEK